MSEKEKVKEKETHVAQDNKYLLRKSFKEIADRIAQKRKEAKENNTWTSLILFDMNGYSFEVTCSPDGRAFLRLVSPNLRNSFIVANADALKSLVEIGKFIEANWKIVNDVISILGTKTSSRRNAEYL
jgi:hypothetical protein